MFYTSNHARLKILIPGGLGRGGGGACYYFFFYKINQFRILVQNLFCWFSPLNSVGFGLKCNTLFSSSFPKWCKYCTIGITKFLIFTFSHKILIDPEVDQDIFFRCRCWNNFWKNNLTNIEMIIFYTISGCNSNDHTWIGRVTNIKNISVLE